MKNVALFLFLFLIIPGTTKIVSAQGLENTSSQAEAKQFSARLAAHLQSREAEFQLTFEQVMPATTMSTKESLIGTTHIYETKDYRMKISLGAVPNEEYAKKSFQDSTVNIGRPGKPIPKLGDEAVSGYEGWIEIRKGTILIGINVTSTEELERILRENNQPAPEPETEAQILERNNWKAEMNQKKREVAERFARHVMDFLETAR